MKMFVLISLVVFSFTSWQPTLAQSSASQTERTKQADDLVPIANEEHELFVKEALRYLQYGHTIPLSVNASCATVGMEFTDKTIGDFTSGMLSQFVYAKGANSKNWITGVCKDSKNSTKKKPIRDCELYFHQARLNEDILWSWGFRFSADQRTGAVNRSSLICVAPG